MADKYYIKDDILKTAVHHESFKQLWETKWKQPASMGVYPFMFGYIKDFEPVVDELIKKDMKEPYDWDEYAKTFVSQAEALATIAAEAEKAGGKEKACEYYLRSSAVYRISRFPTPRSKQQKQNWTRGTEIFLKGAALMEHPVHQVLVPHKHKAAGDGDVIPILHLLPESASPSSPAPLVLIFTGLDGYRTELACWMEGWRLRGVATVIVEIPGTGDCPADRRDPTSPDRLWTSLLDWVDTQKSIDHKKIINWGFSTGGYYSVRLAHTHKDRLLACISLGGGAHHMFDPEWLSEVNHLEYAFDLAGALTYKWGYEYDQEAFKKVASKYSLLNDGTLDKPSTKLLLVNGTQDEIFPIDDMFVVLEHGGPKLARFVPGLKHMGEPESFHIILRWIYGLLGIEGNPVDQLKLLMFKAKY